MKVLQFGLVIAILGLVKLDVTTASEHALKPSSTSKTTSNLRSIDFATGIKAPTKDEERMYTVVVPAHIIPQSQNTTGVVVNTKYENRGFLGRLSKFFD
ncbi:uncharacterized protein CCR75_007974 [Bremia lactucae]|uniref:RxLR effector protein n=1 Tax=Bremia lactucae TaxID=4779 RepID=A0A976ID49_BRELC|nr:hypothetical protein CCR75_007974 [Bremia lactucae]